MESIDDVLKNDDINNLLDETNKDVDNIQSILIAYQSEGQIKWKARGYTSEILGIIRAVEHFILSEYDYSGAG
jgi:hypothetical protein